MEKILLWEMTWEEARKHVEENSLVIVPVGSFEEHGPHLPLSTDSIIVEEVAKKAAVKLAKEIPVVVAPTIFLGYESPNVRKYPGTISLKIETFINLVYDYLCSLIDHGFKRILVINGHGQNYGALRVALRKIYEDKGVPVTLVSLCLSLAKPVAEKYRRSESGGIMHAGELETSLMLTLRENLVNLSKAVKEVSKPPSTILTADLTAPGKVFLTTWSYWKTEKGVLGDPTKATKELGEKALEKITEEIYTIAKELYIKVFPKIEKENIT
ncbi:MAG: hypothetical protein DRJ63_09500 [Thermoprotei archaeon]|nr:MAG: hypothetical protein DRJ63_09500 [Thermoprotei archaeon]